MADYTITRNLKLKIADDLSADAKYNLEKIDSIGGSLASTFTSGSGDQLNIFSRGDIQLVAKEASVGGAGSGGTITLGDSDNLVTVVVEGISFLLRCGLSLPTGSSGGNDTYLTILSATNNTNRNLTLDVDGGNHSIKIADTGTAVIKDSLTGDFSAGTITATFSGNLTGNVTGNLSGNVTGNVTGNVSGTASNVTGIVAVANGGTGADNALTAMVNLLPSYSGNADKVLSLNSAGTALEWKAAGAGQVVSIQSISPIYVDTGTNPGDSGSTANPIISLPAASSSSDGYLSTTDWNIFNNKEPAITASNIATQFWNGNKTFVAIVKSDVGLDQVDNTSDVNKPISSATQTALNSKEPTLTAGTTSQYYRGDKSWQTLDTAAVAENTNLYFTNQRASDVIDTRIVKANWLSGSTLTVTHNFNSTDVAVAMWDITSGESVFTDNTVRNLNDVVLSLPVSASPNFRIIITKK